MSDRYVPTTEDWRRSAKHGCYGISLDDMSEAFDHWLDEVRRETLEGALPKGAEWFPIEQGFMWKGIAYGPLDYVLTRTDINELKAEAWDSCEEKLVEHIERNGTSTAGWPTNPYRKEQGNE